MKTNLDLIKEGFFKGVGWVLALVTVGAVFAVMFIFTPKNAFFSQIGGIFCDVNPKILLSKSEIQSLHCLIEKGAILSPDTMFSQISSYYNSLISFLIGLLSIMGVLAYFSIHNISYRHVKEEVEKGVDLYFDSQTYLKNFKKHVEEEVAFNLRDYEPSVGVEQRLDKLDEDIESIRASLPPILNEIPPEPRDC